MLVTSRSVAIRRMVLPRTAQGHREKESLEDSASPYNVCPRYVTRRILTFCLYAKFALGRYYAAQHHTVLPVQQTVVLTSSSEANYLESRSFEPENL